MKISERQTYIDMEGRTVFVASRQKLGQQTFWTYIGYQVDRAGNRIGEPRGWKSDGRDWVGDMAGNIVRQAETGMKLDEWQGVILDRLIEAFDTDTALPVATGPKMFGNAWPDIFSSEEDIREMERVEDRDWKQHQTRQRHQAIDAFTERRAKCSRPRISRMEEAFSWLSLVLGEEDRQIILAYAEVKARGLDFERFLELRNRKHKTKSAWVKRTILRRIDKILRELASILRKRAIILRDCAGLQVAHEAAKHSCKSISSTVCERDDELNRPAMPMNSPALITGSAEREARRRARLGLEAA